MQRLQKLALTLRKEEVKVMEGDTLKITDNRTGKSFDVTVK